MFDDANALVSQSSFSMPRAALAPMPGPQSDPTALKASAQNFESVFLSQMFSQMFEEVHSDAMFGGGNGEEMFRSLMIDEYAKQVAKRGGLGIADAVMRTLIHQQEKKS